MTLSRCLYVDLQASELQDVPADLDAAEQELQSLQATRNQSQTLVQQADDLRVVIEQMQQQV